MENTFKLVFKIYFLFKEVESPRLHVEELPLWWSRKRTQTLVRKTAQKLEKQKKAIVALAVANTVGIVLKKIQKSRFLQIIHLTGRKLGKVCQG